jgi:hypothetical protein
MRWFPVQIADLPAPMRHELGVWFEVMRAGSTIPPLAGRDGPPAT